MAKPLHIAMIGSGFMGRAHSQAWLSANRFFDLPRQVVLHTVCGRDSARTKAFAKKWGWRNATTELACAVEDDEIDLIDIVTPNHLHAPQAIAALRNGKHVACEKPLAGTLRDAKLMKDEEALSRKRRKTRTFVWFNYRRCPAIALAHQLVRSGKLGRIFHVRAHYLQDWGANAPADSWRLQPQLAGSGAHGDLNAHLIDMARFITGDEIVQVAGALENTFRRGRRGAQMVDDCLLFLAQFKSGAVGSFEATRFATGNLNRNSIEVNGERGAIRFDFQRMNELQWWDQTLAAKLRGWSAINCTQPGAHPYVEAYWPAGHGLGYEHTFISQAADIVRALGGRKPALPLPDFEDAYQTQRVLHAAIESARSRCAVRI